MLWKGKVACSQQISKAYRSSLSTYNILIGHKVHAVSCCSNNSHISNGVESYLLVQGHRPLHPYNGLVTPLAKLLVDAVY